MYGIRPNAFVAFLVRNDSYLPGALLLAYGLLKQQSVADRVCLITPDIPEASTALLDLVFDHVVKVEAIYVPIRDCQRRQHLPFMFTRLQALRLGSDGDLGYHYRKIVLLDADILPMRHFDHLFLLDTPAGILNEQKSHLFQVGPHSVGQSSHAAARGIWNWHEAYREIPHGSRIPRRITDKIRYDNANYGMNTALLVLSPSMMEYSDIMSDLQDEQTRDWISDELTWPEMQYLSLWWSGQWHNVDACFAGLKGYPSLDALFGNHFAGVKPWSVRSKTVADRYSRFEDFQYWYQEFERMMEEFSELKACKRLMAILDFIRARHEIEAR